MDAARTLFSRHGVEDIAAARADAKNLTLTTDAILAGIAEARRDGLHLILFVTGIPGAGKTLCGLNAVFGVTRGAEAAFLTGNPTLVHVLREALARDAANGDRRKLRAARQRMKSAIQALPAFRDHHIRTGDIPPEHVVVIDEAQRAWARDHAVRKSADREVALSQSEPAHLLDIMAAHRDWAVILCLIGHGQEIHDGEGGLAEWGAALAARPDWQVRAPPALRSAADPRHRLPDALPLCEDPRFSSTCRCAASAIPMPRPGSISCWRAMRERRARSRTGTDRCPSASPASSLRCAPLCVARAAANGAAGCWQARERGGFRADGLGAELPHMEADAVAHWFLDRWPQDVRASDALEVVATEFSCQGLELDHVGLCWAGDLAREPGRTAWRVRDFKGTRWQTPTGAEAIANRINTYRVLLTRARYETIIWLPRGDPGRPDPAAGRFRCHRRLPGILRRGPARGRRRAGRRPPPRARPDLTRVCGWPRNESAGRLATEDAMSPFDLPRNAANFAALTPLSFIARAAAVWPERVAVVHGGIRRSWAETYARCRRLASALAARGIGRGDTVAVMAPNVPALLEAHFGVPMAGAVLNALNIRLDAATIAFILEHGGAKVLITDGEFAPTVQAALAAMPEAERPFVVDIDDPLGPLGADRRGHL